MPSKGLNGVKTDIHWIKQTLEDHTEQLRQINEKLSSLEIFKAQVRTEAKIQARLISVAWSIVPVSISIALLILRILGK